MARTEYSADYKDETPKKSWYDISGWFDADTSTPDPGTSVSDTNQGDIKMGTTWYEKLGGTLLNNTIDRITDKGKAPDTPTINVAPQKSSLSFAGMPGTTMMIVGAVVLIGLAFFLTRKG